MEEDDGEIPPHRRPTPAAAAPPPLPIQPHQETTTSGYRSHRWSEATTAVLIEAWTKRFLELCRGFLRPHDWKDVADIVAAQTGRSCTGDQCKNRIDTVKKKYKEEKSLVADGVRTSDWPFFNRLDQLFNPPADDGTDIPIGLRKRSKRPPVADSDEPEPGNSSDGLRKRKKPTVNSGNSLNELPQAILKFGKAYEQEMEKKSQKDLELQRMRDFIEPSQPNNNGDDPINENDSDELESLIRDLLSRD